MRRTCLSDFYRSRSPKFLTICGHWVGLPSPASPVVGPVGTVCVNGISKSGKWVYTHQVAHSEFRSNVTTALLFRCPKKNPRRLDSARHDDFARSCGHKPFRRHLHLKLSLAREKLFTDCDDSISHPRDVKLLQRPRVWHFVLV
jgi:hypothetical protein